MLNLYLARRIIDATLVAAAVAGSKPLTIVVVDASGTPISLERQDGCGMSRPALSLAKADSCLALNMPTRTLASFHAGQPAMHALLRETTGKALIPLAGGVLIKNPEGQVIGAAGVSGGLLEQEEDMLIQAILDCGLTPDPADFNSAKTA